MIIIRLFMGLVAFVGLIFFLSFGMARHSLPDLDGRKVIPGLAAEVSIARDAHGIPHISADNATDLHFAMGYVHAQDRLFQMEINRRVGRGQLSEILGEAGLAFDRMFRTYGFTQRAGNAYALLPKEGRAALIAYAKGINSYIKSHRGSWPPEFEILGFEPKPWHPTDSLIWQKLMWLDLSGNMRYEAIRARLLTRLTPDQVTALYPPHPGDSEPPLPSLEDIYEEIPFNSGQLKRVADLFGGEPVAGYGSNNWVVSGSLTKSGMPLLANDPHLGLSTPSIWYLVRLHNRSTGKNAVGVGFPGSPGIVLGRNDRIAWGFTNTAPDIQDLYVEKILDEKTYLSADGPKPFITREETIRVKDGKPVRMTIRSTRHGPLITDIIGAAKGLTKDGYGIALQWTALRQADTGSFALMQLNDATDFDSFVAAGQAYLGPQQNMVYADIDGNIGYHAPAVIPVRHRDNKVMGRLPVPGWDARYDWQGFVPIDEVPRRFNPENGIIATANERIVDDSYTHFITRDWSLPYRGNRIREDLASRAPHDASSFKRLHGDIVSDMARDTKSLLIAAVKDKLDDDAQAKALVDSIALWDGSMDKDKTEPLVFHTWIRSFQTLLIADELGPLASAVRGLKPRLIKSALFHSLPGVPVNDDFYALPVLSQESALPWCDNVSTAMAETCPGLALSALKAAITTLSNRYGPKPSDWRWGRAHQLTQKHSPFSDVAGLGDLFHLQAEQDGGRYTVNVAGNSTDPRRPHISSFGPSYRGIFDMKDLDQSLYVQPTGQSGHPLSPYFQNLFPLWQSVNYIKIPTNEAVPADSKHLLVLSPAD